MEFPESSHRPGTGEPVHATGVSQGNQSRRTSTLWAASEVGSARLLNHLAPETRGGLRHSFRQPAKAVLALRVVIIIPDRVLFPLGR